MVYIFRMVPELTSRQRRHLRALAHALDPVVQLGRQGSSVAALAEIDRALATHELVKVRLAAGRGERPALVRELEEGLSCAAAGVIGQVAILYRPHLDPARRRIELPT
jgi:RNA-binding protein